MRMRALPSLLTVTLLLSTPLAAAASVDDQVLLLRYAVLVGGREAGQAPLVGEARSSEELAQLLVDWQPGDDNDEVRELFALEGIGELVRQALVLDAEGGEARSTYLHQGVGFEVAFKVRPEGESWTAATIQLRRDGALLMAPTLRARLGERTITSVTDGPEAPFIFLVLEVDRVARESLRSRGLGLAWRDDLVSLDRAGVTPPRVVSRTPPAYSPEGRAARIQGVVILRALIDKRGEVEAVEVLKGLPLGLSEAAVAAVENWTFEPARLDGEPVDVLYNVTVNFRIEP